MIPDTWDQECDVAVIGFGGAGVAAAVTAHDLGAEVLIAEKAPKGLHGGNTRVAAQGYLNTSSTEEAIQYLTALCGPYTVPARMIEVWAEEMGQNNEWLAGLGGDPQEHQHPPAGIEFPELPGAQSSHKFHDGPVLGYGKTWDRLESFVLERDIRVHYDTPARDLIQDPHSGEILGIRAETAGKPLHIKARRGVVLTCGGFENNQELIRTYLSGVPYCFPQGTPYNEGDGIPMAQTVGADLWHMNNFAGPTMALKVPEFPATLSMQALHFSKEFPGGMIVVGPDGRRFADEKFKNRHGKVPMNGVWRPMALPCPMFMIFDHPMLASGPLYNTEPNRGWTAMMDRYPWSDDNSAEIEKGWITKADTLEGLARLLGLDGLALDETVNRWNAQVAAGADTDFGRTLMLNPLEKSPFYAVELSPAMLNTQGGPRRNERSEILRPDGTRIPRLYSAGELGSIFSNLYQGTGNIGEAFGFGRIAGRNVAAETPWG
ncbi:MAG: FAD-binding protein [Thalassobaculaceae bacterium]|nr:FAD-binding protein [Thalassobaculaceae bacterium]